MENRRDLGTPQKTFDFTTHCCEKFHLQSFWVTVSRGRGFFGYQPRGLDGHLSVLSLHGHRAPRMVWPASGFERPSICQKRTTTREPISRLLKKAPELAIAGAARNSSSLKPNKKRDSVSQRTSK
jgi:hypothetical protein